MTFSRRNFMVGCSAAIAALAGGRLTNVAFGSPEDEPNQEILVSIFLRGGMDGLNLVPPIEGPDRGHYEDARSDIQVPAADLATYRLSDLFGLHPGAAPFHELYQAGKLAVIHAAGLTSDTRSHFDAMNFMELGTPGVKATTTGWLTRHLESADNLPAEILMPAMAANSLSPTSLRGSSDAVAMSNPSSFGIGGNWYHDEFQRMALREIYTGNTWLHQYGSLALDAIDIIESANPGSYTPANGASYPGGSFGNNLKTVAQMIKLQLGLRVATVDLGGWDTHENQGTGTGGYFSGQIGQLAQGLHALYADLDGAGGENYTSRLTVVVMSEFGRRLKENANRGTDHGHGNVMFVLGGNVNGGQVYGQWPGLATDQLYDRADLAITTDYRRVLSEILIRRLGNPKLGTVFPGYENYTPLGILQGEDMEPVYYQDGTPMSNQIFLPQVVR
jgi:uncharacterized protein (DUF1501 family)